jgi:hypothetical protein
MDLEAEAFGPAIEIGNALFENLRIGGDETDLKRSDPAVLVGLIRTTGVGNQENQTFWHEFILQLCGLRRTASSIKNRPILKLRRRLL